MSDFKVGDKVLFVGEGFSLILKRDEVYTILDTDEDAGIMVRSGFWYSADLFRKLTKLDKALQ